MHDFEKMGAFYLGRTYDIGQGRILDDLVLYDSTDLTTHGVCVGMTGSGKTGLCISLLEEAAIDGVPAIAIDPKGDLGNLLLAFPDLQAADFRPWIDEEQAARKGVTPDAFAAHTAKLWRDGLAQWGQDGGRIARLKAAADVAIYTPGSTAGRPLNILRSFDACPESLMQDADAFRDRIESAVSGLLALLGIEADPVRSREHILISNILHRAWSEGRNLDLATLIREIQEPPFDRVGVLDVESVYPAKERFELAIGLNNLLASPGFEPWLEGAPLSIDRLLYTEEGRPRVSILNIAYLSDTERMFFVTLLLNEVVAWVRQQPGTPSLRALLYMDEIFGYFPPSAMPPSKKPMLTLLKQARAFGLGILLATQNPVDLDYKGLANTGTWFIGRLQTERDKARVIDGLESAASTTGVGFDRRDMDAILSSLSSRVFLMHNVHENSPVILHSRWALSYLRGPLTRAQIRTLTEGDTEAAAPPPEQTPAPPAIGWPEAPVAAPPPTAEKPRSEPADLPPDVEQYFLPVVAASGVSGAVHYRPAVLGWARLHYIRVTAEIDLWRDLVLLADIPEQANEIRWEGARSLDPRSVTLTEAPIDLAAQFSPIPDEALTGDRCARWRKAFGTHAYRAHPLVILRCPEMKAVSEPGESEGAFRARLGHMAREQRDLAVQKLRERYGRKLGAIQDRRARAEERLARERAELSHQTLQTSISVGATLVGALFGRKAFSRRNVRGAARAARGAGRSLRKEEDVGRARRAIAEQDEKLAALEQELADEIAEVEARLQSGQFALERISINPRKNELTVQAFGIAWSPWLLRSDGTLAPLFTTEA
jgi:DNA helicase HerA-like ATPase